MRRRWHFHWTGFSQMAVDIAGIAGAVTAWPSDLSWALVAIAGLATLGLVNFHFEYGDPEAESDDAHSR